MAHIRYRNKSIGFLALLFPFSGLPSTRPVGLNQQWQHLVLCREIHFPALAEKPNWLCLGGRLVSLKPSIVGNRKDDLRSWLNSRPMSVWMWNPARWHLSPFRSMSFDQNDPVFTFKPANCSSERDWKVWYYSNFYSSVYGEILYRIMVRNRKIRGSCATMACE